MTRLREGDFAERLRSQAHTEALLSELAEQLSGAPKVSGSRGPAAALSVTCDRVLRACVEQLGRPALGAAHAASLVTLACVAGRGCAANSPSPAPLYLEKLLYHVLRNAAAQGAAEATWTAADFLRTRLLTYEPQHVASEDFVALAQSSFGVLWSSAEALAGAGGGEDAGRAALAARLRALRFLALLGDAASAPLPREPPFLTSKVARQAAAAAALFRSHREPLSAADAAFLSQQLRQLLVALRDGSEGAQPPAMCTVELALLLCTQLCRSGRHTEAWAAVEETRRSLGRPTRPLAAPLALLDAGVSLSRALAEDGGAAQRPLSQAAAALGSAPDASERSARLLAEGCHFIVLTLGHYVESGKRKPFAREFLSSLCPFVESYCGVIHRLLQEIPLDSSKEQLRVKQLLYYSLQIFTNVAYSTFQCSQVRGWRGLEQLLGTCQRVVEWMLAALEGLLSSKRAEYLEITASCTFKLAYIFYSQNLHKEVISLSKLFCKWLESTDVSQHPEIPPDKLHRCFRLQVESCWKQGLFEEALAAVVQWLAALRDRLREQMVEPVSLWARVKADATKKGRQEIQLWTLKDALKGCQLDVGTLVALLFEELKAYKSVRASTGRERYNVVCDLLELCSEESGRTHQRATGLVELAQVLCYHDCTAHTDCSALDSIQEALRLLESVPRTAQNQDELLDDRAQALLWLYICTLEAKLKESIEREQRARAQGQKNLEDFEPNDLNYEDKLQEDKFLYDGIVFNLAAESAQSQSLDDAFALWKQLLEKKGVPGVRSPEQTVASLHIMAALYKLMSKPLQALESYLLVRSLCSALGDNLGMAGALCQVTKLLFQLECPSYAKLFLEETESCLRKADGSGDSCVLLEQTCLLLRSQLCCTSHQVGEGLALLLAVHQNPVLQKASKVWYLLRAHVLELTATYLGLPPARLPPELRQQLSALGWRTPETALTEAHKLFRSIVLLVMGSNMLGSQKTVSDAQFVDYGDNLLQKWQVLADLLACSEQLVAALGRVEMVTEAKAFCLEAIKLAMKLHAARWCVAFLVLKAQLELQRSELELSRCDLRQAQFLLESSTEFEGSKKQHRRRKILLCKGELEGSRRRPPGSEAPAEEAAFLKGPALEFVATVSGPGEAAALSTSPELKPKQKRHLGFLGHPSACSCSLCSDVTLSALCLRWLLCCAQLELAGAGGATEGLGLLEATLRRCQAVAARFVTVLRDKLRGGPAPLDGQALPALELLDDLMATVYATLASQSLASCQAEEKLQEAVEAGLTFLQSRRPHLPSLEICRATLLLAKATATICTQVPHRKGSVTGVFASAWAWQPPPTPVEPKGSAALEALRTEKALPQRSKSRKGTVTVAGPKAKVKKSQRVKALAATDLDDIFAVGDLDGEVPPIVIRPVTLPHTPHEKPCPPAKAAAPRAPFRVFIDSSPAPDKSQLLKAPRAKGRAKSRLKVMFSDDSDVEDPKPKATAAAGKALASSHKTSEPTGRSWRVPGPKSAVAVATGSRTTRTSSRRSDSTEGKREQATRRAPRRRVEEKRELMRTIEEEEKPEEKVEICLEVLRAHEEEEGVSGSRWKEGADGVCEVLRQEANRDNISVVALHDRDPLHLEVLSNALPASDAASLDAACKLLKAAFNCISHCPPSALYSRLCQLLALARGEQDPVGTAYLVCEALSVTLRHQLLSSLHRSLHKAKKSPLGVTEQLRGLSLQEESAAPCSRPHRHLAQLQDLFAFSSSELGPQDQERFREQLEQIPSGVTVCLMTLVSLQPALAGDTLLLTRLEKGSAPITIRISTGCSKAPLSSMLREFDAIQREQKESINCTDHMEWWQCRLKLDQRMKSLIETLETGVLGCWKGALHPGSPEPGLAEEAAGLCARLRQCGGARVDAALLTVLLKASALLTPRDVQSLASGFCPAQPSAAQILLQEALEKREGRARRAGGSLVLVLDKHLQRLPWESMAFLRDVSVTRLPSLRFLLSYSLAREERAGSVLSRGVNPASTFYILNPHNNLPGTEQRFRGWFESEPGWNGVTGAIPRQEQMQAALSEHDLYIYAGHGAGARFLDGQSLARLECSAVALLFGCSSAALAVRGALEGSGIVLKYLMAGCPLVLGNLWDVTDRDIDRYAEALLQGWLRAGAGAPLLRYVARARLAPKLKALIGAAPVAYGLPVGLQPGLGAAPGSSGPAS